MKARPAAAVSTKLIRAMPTATIINEAYKKMGQIYFHSLIDLQLTSNIL